MGKLKVHQNVNKCLCRDEMRGDSFFLFLFLEFWFALLYYCCNTVCVHVIFNTSNGATFLITFPPPHPKPICRWRGPKLIWEQQCAVNCPFLFFWVDTREQGTHRKWAGLTPPHRAVTQLMESRTLLRPLPCTGPPGQGGWHKDLFPHRLEPPSPPRLRFLQTQRWWNPKETWKRLPSALNNIAADQALPARGPVAPGRE